MHGHDMPRTEDDYKNYVAQSLRDGSMRLVALESSVAEIRIDAAKNMALTEQTRNDTAELLEIFKAIRGGVTVLGWLGKIGKWLVGIAAAVVILQKLFGFKWPTT